MKSLRILLDIMRLADTQLLEIFLALLSLTWGVIVLVSPLDPIDSTKSLQPLGELAGKEVWGPLCIAVGAFRFYALRRSSPRLRKWASLCGLFLWASILYSTILSGSIVPQIATCVCACISSIYIFIRISFAARATTFQPHDQVPPGLETPGKGG